MGCRGVEQPHRPHTGVARGEPEEVRQPLVGLGRRQGLCLQGQHGDVAALEPARHGAIVIVVEPAAGLEVLLPKVLDQLRDGGVQAVLHVVRKGVRVVLDAVVHVIIERRDVQVCHVFALHRDDVRDFFLGELGLLVRVVRVHPRVLYSVFPEDGTDVAAADLERREQQHKLDSG